MRRSRSLTADEVDGIITDTYGPRLDPEGFDATARRRWVRGTKAPIRETVSIGALKGHAFSPTWSISLDFVPHVTAGGRIQRQRTVADLGVDPLDHPEDFDLDGLTVAGLTTPRRFRTRMRRSADLTARYAAEWFAHVTDVASLVPLYEAAQRRPARRFGFDSHVQYRLSFAFVLAHLGDLSRARAELDRWCDRHLDDPQARGADLRPQLHELLERAT